MRPFRVLLVDDSIAAALEKNNNDLTFNWSSSEHPGWILKSLRELGSNYGHESSANLHAYFSKDLSFKKAPVWPVTPAAPEWQESLLWSLDVLVLDLGGVGPLRNEWKLPSSNYACDPEEAKILNGSYPGAAFYLRNLERLKACQAVIFLTQYDKSATPPVVLKHVDSKCHPDSIPWTVKYSIDRDDILKVVNLIKSLYEDFSNGYTQLESRGAIEFAASHDMPVLLVGESGTGKEYIAHAIHRRWAQEKRRKGEVVPDNPTVVNCAGLTKSLARSELFGHVRGSFTSADNHRIGAILSTCGCHEIVPAATARDSFVQEYRQGLLRNTGSDTLPLLRQLSNIDGDTSQAVSRYQQQSFDLKFQRNSPTSTLFLDEFGDLPIEVQALLLRYLQTWDVQPFGYPGRILNAKLRVIAATSDPRIATLAGEELLGGWRSSIEMMKGIREDLIFRVKGQVIRAEPIRVDNVRESLNHFIERYECADIWADSAKDYIVNTIQEQLTLLAEQSESSSTGKAAKQRPAFGHRRELERIVKLANAFVKGAQDRGLRIANVVNKDVVTKIWKPSNVLSFDAAGPVAGSAYEPTLTDVTSKSTSTQLRASMLKHGVVKMLRESFWPDCSEGFVWKEVLKSFEDKYNSDAKTQLCMAFLRSTLFHISGSEPIKLGELEVAWGAEDGNDNKVRNHLRHVREEGLKMLLKAKLSNAKTTAALGRVAGNGKWWEAAASEIKKAYSDEMPNYRVS